MNMTLLLPAGLAALAALLLPLLIHLAKRSQVKVTDFAALRWLAARPQPRHKRRFEEWPLLAVRLLLLALLALLLAEPLLHGQTDRSPWIAVAPGVDASALQSIQSRQKDTTAHMHWLSPGFPAVDLHSPAPRNLQPTASLLRELDAQLPSGTPLTVVVPTVIDGADAERPRLTRAVEWHVVAAAPQVPDVAADGSTSSAKLESAGVAVAIRHDSGHASVVHFLRAATSAWHSLDATQSGQPDPPASTVADISAAIPRDVNLLLWMASGPLPDAVQDWVRSGGTALLAADTETGRSFADASKQSVPWRDADGLPLVHATAFGAGRLMQFNRELTPAAMPQLLQPDFPRQLRGLTTAPASPQPSRVSATDYQPLAGGQPYPDAPRRLAPWLVLLIGMLFLLERWLACGTRRRMLA